MPLINYTIIPPKPSIVLVEWYDGRDFKYAGRAPTHSRAVKLGRAITSYFRVRRVA